MRTLLKVFFLFAALMAEAAVKIVYRPRAQAAPGAVALVNDAELILRRTLRLTYPKGRELFVVFLPQEQAPAPLTLRNGRWLLECHGQDIARFCSARELNRLFSAIVAAGYGLPVPNNPVFLPKWVTAAFREALTAAKGRERIFRGNRNALSLGALLDREPGPDFRSILRMDPEKLSPPEDKFYREIARLLLDLTAPRHLLRPLLTRCAAGEPDAAQEALEKAFTDSMKEKDFNAALLRAGRNWLWSEVSPRPADRERKDLQAFRRSFPLPELNEAGEPTGKTLELSLKEVVPLLSKRPDGQTQARKILLKLHEFSRQDTRWFRLRFPELSALVTGLATSPDGAAQLEAFLDRLEIRLQKRSQTESFLQQEEQSHTPARLFFRCSLEEANPVPAAETPELSRWLERQSQ